MNNVTREFPAELPDNNVPYVSGAVGEFRNLFHAAYTQNVRGVIIGDSQESYGGFGNHFVPGLNVEAVERFGQSSESDFYPSGESYGSGSPPVRFGHRGAFVSVSRIDDDTVLPSARGAVTNANGRTFTFSAPRLIGQTSGALAFGNRNQVYFDHQSATLAVEVYLRTSTAGPAEVQVRGSEQDIGSTLSFGPYTLNETSSGLGLDQSDGEVVVYRTQAFLQQVVDPNRSFITDIRGGGNIEGLQILGSRVVDVSKNSGMNINSFSAGGYTNELFFANHENAGPTLSVYGPWDVVFCMMGANQHFQSPEVYRDSMVNFVETIRSADWLNNPNQLIALVSDDYREPGDTFNSVNYAEQPRVNHEIATSMDGVVAFNMHRFTDDAGFESSPLLFDATHLTTEGQIVKSRLFMDAWQRIANGEINADS